MVKRLTYEDVKYFVEVESNSGCELLSNKYKNMHTKMTFQCKCGDEFETVLATFKNKNKRQCNACGYKKTGDALKFTYEEVVHFIEVKSDSKCKLLSKEYKNVDSKIEIQCQCGNEFTTTFYNFKNKNKKQCDECGWRISADKQKLDYNFVKKHIESFEGYAMISKEYVNSRTKLKVMCPSLHVFEVTWDNFKKGKRCGHSDCLGKAITKGKSTPIEDIILELDKVGFKLIQIVGDFKGKRSRAIIECSNGHKYERNISNILTNGSKCRICAHEEMSIERQKETTQIKRHLRTIIEPWKSKCLIHNNYRCLLTGKNGKLEVHHIYSFNKMVVDVHNVLNLDIKGELQDYTEKEITSLQNEMLKLHTLESGFPMLKELHREFHTIYGYNNNVHQLNEFIEDFKNRKYESTLHVEVSC